MLLLLSKSLGFSSVSSFSRSEQLAMSSWCLGEFVDCLVEADEAADEDAEFADDGFMIRCVSTPVTPPRLCMVVAMVWPEVLVLFASELLPPESLLSLLDAASHSFMVLSELDSQCKFLAISSNVGKNMTLVRILS